MTALRYNQNKSETAPSDQKQQTTTTTSTTSTTTTYHTDPGVSCSALDLEVIRQMYNSVIGDLNAVKARDIEEALQYMDASAVKDAIEQTAFAARPTHYYLRAILRRYQNDRIRTAKDAERDRYIRRHKQQEAKWQREEWFTHASEDLPF